jgi:putative ABC transport system substrate-binding protein
MSERRKLLIALGASTLTAPLRAFAQGQITVWRVGFLTAYSRQTLSQSGRIEAFLQEMRKLGYLDGKNLGIEWRFADENYKRLDSMAAELVRLNVHVIVAGPSPAIRAAQRATATIPIVMASTGDPVGSGFIASLARPGGNITGSSNETDDISEKYLELLMTVVPKLSRVAILGDPNSSTYGNAVKILRAAAQRAGVTVIQSDVRTPDDLARSFSTMAREGAMGLVAVPSGFTAAQGPQIAQLASQFRIPAIYAGRSSVVAGGLMSYGPVATESYMRAAHYVDKILKGMKPSELPVEQPTTFELVINLNTAKVLGLTLPQSLLQRADAMIP